MKTKIVAALVMITLIFGALFAANFFLGTKKKQNKATVPVILIKNSDPDTGSVSTKPDTDSIDDALKSMDTGKCNSLGKLKEHCIDLVMISNAKLDNDDKLCEEIGSQTLKKECNDFFDFKKAVESNDKAECEKIIGNTEAKNDCLNTIIMKEVGTIGFSGSVSICDSLTHKNKINCITQVEKIKQMNLLNATIDKKDLNACSSITDQRIRSSCLNTLNLDNGMNSVDKSSCNSITDKNNKAACISSVQKNQDSANFQTAAKSNDITSCASISEAESKNTCINLISLKKALASKNASECERITDSLGRSKCMNTVKMLNSLKK